MWTRTVTSTDRLALLREARDRLVDAMNGELLCRSCGRGAEPALAAVIKELRAVLTEIDAVPGSGEVSDLDRIADGVADFAAAQHRRTSRRSDAAGS